MAEKKQESTEKLTEKLDENGLVIQEFEHMVLVVVPQQGYREETMRYARSSLLCVHVGTWAVSAQSDEFILGRLQDEFLADGPLEGVSMDDYAGVMFVDGDPAMNEDPAVIQLAESAHAKRKLIAAWGDSVGILAEAGVINGRKLTGASRLKDQIRIAGGKFTGVEWQRDGHIVTARDDSAGFRLGQAMVQVIALQ